LFLAPVNYTLKDYRTWPQTEAADQEQAAHARVKVFPTMDYSFAKLWTAVGPNSTQALARNKIGSQQKVG
jgi:hypothetical protein